MSDTMQFANQEVSSLSPFGGAAHAPAQGQVADVVSAGGALSQGGIGAAAKGPFRPAVNSLLSACFGHMVDGIELSRNDGAKNDRIGAKAHTLGRKISLGSDIREDPSDPHSMEVIGHEVAHALAHGGSGLHALDRKGDPGESAAYDTGRRFRHFVEGGGRGPVPQLKPAFGGQAAIHRFEAGEHAHAVDNAADIIAEEQKAGKATDVHVSDDVKALMSNKITLKNGVKVTPGEITALMGDFYGAFDKTPDGKEHFNAAKSFEALQNADPAEMEKLLKIVNNEKKGVEAAIKDGGKKGSFEPTDPGELESLTARRRTKTDADGTTTGYSFLELAERNKNHFNSKDESGADNNVGAYSTFHKMALEAAKNGDIEKARALEASAQHFMTDRFAGGHQFDKAKIQQAADKGDLGGNVVARIIHNQMNEDGVTVRNDVTGPDGKKQEWKALGDGHWSDKENQENRLRTATAVTQSFDEIDQVYKGNKKISDIEKEGYAAKKSAPQWDQGRQEGAEMTARNLSYWDIAKKEIGEAPGAVKGKATRLLGEAENWAGDKWDGAKKAVGGAWDWTRGKVGAAWDGAKHAAGEAWDGVKHGASDAWDFTKDQASAAKRKAGEAVDWGKEKLGNAWDATKEGAGNLWSGTKDLAQTGWNGVKDAASTVSNTAGSVWSGAKHGASEAWSGAKGAAQSGWDWLKKKVGG